MPMTLKTGQSPWPLQPLTSTLRLKLGAFFAEISAPESTSDQAVQALIDLQMELEGFSK